MGGMKIGFGIFFGGRRGNWEVVIGKVFGGSGK
jgi:hypothetical protein